LACWPGEQFWLFWGKWVEVFSTSPAPTLAYVVLFCSKSDATSAAALAYMPTSFWHAGRENSFGCFGEEKKINARLKNEFLGELVF
jgi:hypothetical protein